MSTSAIVTEITAADIPWLAPAPWPDARPIVTLALARLPVMDDDDAAAVIEHLIMALADLRAERDALRESLRASLALTQQAHRERDRITERYYEALDRLRARATS